ncbi:hypothetical protein [Microvirga sp. P5_D2]
MQVGKAFGMAKSLDLHQACRLDQRLVKALRARIDVKIGHPNAAMTIWSNPTFSSLSMVVDTARSKTTPQI